MGGTKTQFEQMTDGLNDVEAFLAGVQEGFKTHVPQEVDVKAIRNRLGMTQARFSDTFGFSLDAMTVSNVRAGASGVLRLPSQCLIAWRGFWKKRRRLPRVCAKYFQ